MLKKDYRLLFNTPQKARRFLFSEDTSEKLVADYAARFGRESLRIGFEVVFNLPKPALIKTPMLVIGSDGDTLITRKFVEKTARAYRADYKIFPRLGHAVMLESNWQPVADFMIEWLKNFDASRRDSEEKTL
jgi:pimeloyl-ACP methyl ester carboxylesterase